MVRFNSACRPDSKDITNAIRPTPTMSDQGEGIKSKMAATQTFFCVKKTNLKLIGNVTTNIK